VDNPRSNIVDGKNNDLYVALFMAVKSIKSLLLLFIFDRFLRMFDYILFAQEFIDQTQSTYQNLA
jgi:hypothetical protein